jgi:hypothetical protein
MGVIDEEWVNLGKDSGRLGEDSGTIRGIQTFEEDWGGLRRVNERIGKIGKEWG